MTLANSFQQYSLSNRLGQTLELSVRHVQAFGRETIFVAPLTQQASSLVAKNSEHFAFQLREIFNLDTRRFEMVELRGDHLTPNFYRWRFEWVGNSPVSSRCDAVISNSQHNQLMTLLNKKEVNKELNILELDIQSGLQAASA